MSDYPNPTNTQTAETLFKTLYIEESAQLAAAEIIAAGIEEAHANASDNWAVNLGPDRVWLRAGHLVVCGLTNSGIWLALDKTMLQETNIDLPVTGVWEWETNRYREYTSIRSKNGTYQLSPDHEEHWPRLRPFFLSAVARASLARPLDDHAAKYHAPGMIAFLASLTMGPLPNPE